MKSIIRTLQRPFVWLSRFRHRCGYGVHSPFAYDLITQVIYQRTPYYKYKDLAEAEKKFAPGEGKKIFGTEGEKELSVTEGEKKRYESEKRLSGAEGEKKISESEKKLSEAEGEKKRYEAEKKLTVTEGEKKISESEKKLSGAEGEKKISESEKKLSGAEGKQRDYESEKKQWHYEPLKTKRLLFRLVNYARPDTVIDAGTLAASALYLKAAREGADYTAAASLSELFLEAGVPVDFLYLHDYRHPQFVSQVFSLLAPRTRQQSVFVIEGIRYTRAMKSLWRQLQHDPRAGITFDLYDLGIIFFDKSKTKQDYIVNF